MFGCRVRGLKVTRHLIFFQFLYSCCACKVTLPNKHVSPKTCHTGFYYTPPSTDWDSFNLGYLKGKPLASRLHANKIEGFGGWFKTWIPRSWSFLGFSQPCRRKQLNRCNERLKNLTIFAHSAIPTLFNRRRLLSTWKLVQEQTKKLRCWRWAALTATKP